MECPRALSVVCRCQLLCAGCGNGEGHVAPVYAKRSLTQLLTVKHTGFGTFCLKTLSGSPGASGCLLGVWWVLPDEPRCFLMAPDACRCFQMYIYHYIYILIHDLLRVGHGICKEKLCSETLFAVTCLSSHSFV